MCSLYIPSHTVFVGEGVVEGILFSNKHCISYQELCKMYRLHRESSIWEISVINLISKIELYEDSVYSLESPHWVITIYPLQIRHSFLRKTYVVGPASVGCASFWWSEVVGSIPGRSVNILSWRWIMKYILRSFPPFHWSRKAVVSFCQRMCTRTS